MIVAKILLMISWYIFQPTYTNRKKSWQFENLFFVIVGNYEKHMPYCYIPFPTTVLKNLKTSTNEPPHDKTNKMACAPSKDSDQPGHPPSLIRVFAVRMKKIRVLSYPLSAQRRLWSDWADAQTDLSLHWAHSHFVGFVMRRLNFIHIYCLDSTECKDIHIWWME